MGRRLEGIAFKDPAILAEMLLLRKGGWSYAKIGEKYDRDHSTIIYWCQKCHLTLSHKVKRIPYRPLPKINITYVKEENINTGKSYKEYLEAEQKRKLGKLSFLATEVRTDFLKATSIHQTWKPKREES